MSIVDELVGRLDDNLREDYEERAGIVEFDGGQPRELAEALALLDVLKRHPGALLGVTCVEVGVGGNVDFLVTTDGEVPGRHRRVDLADVLRSHFGGTAGLRQI